MHMVINVALQPTLSNPVPVLQVLGVEPNHLPAAFNGPGQ